MQLQVDILPPRFQKQQLRAAAAAADERMARDQARNTPSSAREAASSLSVEELVKRFAEINME